MGSEMCIRDSSQDVIGATKMDEKFLQEIRRQEQILGESGVEEPQGETDQKQAETVEETTQPTEEKMEPAVAPPDGQRTLFGGDV